MCPPCKCLAIRKNVPWHILAPAAAACGIYLIRRSAHPRGSFLLCGKAISCKVKKHHAAVVFFHEQGYKDSNLEMTESESVALPFGDSPLLCQQWVFYMKTFHSSSTFSIFFRFFAKSFYRSSKNLDCTVQICKFNGLFPHQLCLSTGGIRKFLF